MSSRYSTPDYTLDDMRSEPLIGYDYVQNGIRYYPDRDQWSPAWEPEPSQASQPSPNDMVVDPPVIEEAKPITRTASGSNGKAPIDPVLSNNLFRSTSTGPMEKIVIPKGMEIVETPGYYYPLKSKWHFVYDPQERYDLSSIPTAVPRISIYNDPHPFVCVAWNENDPELPPGLPVPFLKTTAPIDLSSNSSSPAPSSQSSSAPSTSSDASSTASSAYPPISAYIGLNHQGVQRLLLDDHNPPSAVCIYTEEDVMRIFEGIAPDYVHMCSEYPPSSLAESDRRVMFFENMQWHFRNKRSTYLSTREF
ncbi:hypothetical protein PGTUg99_016479 [Puccinia graminis f. sp. tritici]|uniref:Uncharacterized protein n=3 Tax=Puccinia graminis f. sp. tritici TaxID=56615 RepID=E3K6U5_PUCGT|nr:uncharacterized protein PGTG_05170 [Puccinia graminis f. sp. tritici CRL 75-36-700-3]EFP79945.1 hypothetical protein PGTG_05170 [Puccinia graminis f. sp. tritici CRL 75-36-700-3]KAA1134830.1 hypothetical protein PGTUg99_016479 [Puccinia graminis f. sp. tritici]